jgi:hypothetical protein
LIAALDPELAQASVLVPELALQKVSVLELA